MEIMLTDLADWLREGGCQVKEYSGWQDRVRGGGPYSDMPLCVMWHHTASAPSWDGQKDADYIAEGSENAPISNLYIERSGLVWVIAAGPSNTNGSGNSMTFSRGTVPVDGMNSRALGIECGNDGIGEQWPEAQIDSLFRASNIVNAKCGNRPTDISSHHHYAPTRKIDPATCNVAGPWVPRSINSSGTWNLDDMRSECDRRSNQPIDNPPIDNPEDEDEMIFDGIWTRDCHNAVYAIYKNGTKVWIRDQAHQTGIANLARINGATEEMCNPRETNDPGLFAAFGLVIGPVPPGCDDFGNPV